MAVPATMADLSAVASSNSPAGTDAIGTNLDDYLRAIQAIVRQIHGIATSAIASAATIDVAAADGESVAITGTTTISSLGTGYVGCYRELRFVSPLTMVNSANLKLPGGVNLSVAAEDIYGFRCVSSGAWRLVSRSS